MSDMKDSVKRKREDAAESDDHVLSELDEMAKRARLNEEVGGDFLSEAHRMEDVWRRRFCHFVPAKKTRLGDAFQAAYFPEKRTADATEAGESDTPPDIGGTRVDPSIFEAQFNDMKESGKLAQDFEDRFDEHFDDSDKDATAEIDTEYNSADGEGCDLMKSTAAFAGDEDDDDEDDEDFDMAATTAEFGDTKDSEVAIGSAEMSAKVRKQREELAAEIMEKMCGDSEDDSDFEVLTTAERETQISMGIGAAESGRRVMDGVIASRMRMEADKSGNPQRVSEVLVKWKGQMAPEWVVEDTLDGDADYHSVVDAFHDEMDDEYFIHESVIDADLDTINVDSETVEGKDTVIESDASAHAPVCQ